MRTTVSVPPLCHCTPDQLGSVARLGPISPPNLATLTIGHISSGWSHNSTTRCIYFLNCKIMKSFFSPKHYFHILCYIYDSNKLFRLIVHNTMSMALPQKSIQRRKPSGIVKADKTVVKIVVGFHPRNRRFAVSGQNGRGL